MATNHKLKDSCGWVETVYKSVTVVTSLYDVCIERRIYLLVGISTSSRGLWEWSVGEAIETKM